MFLSHLIPTPRMGFLRTYDFNTIFEFFRSGGYPRCCIVDYDTWFSVARGFRSFSRRYCLSQRTQLICYPATSTPTVQKLMDTQYEDWGSNRNYPNIINKAGIIIRYSMFPFNTLRTGAFKLFKCTFPGSKQFKLTFILCFFKYL